MINLVLSSGRRIFANVGVIQAGSLGIVKVATAILVLAVCSSASLAIAQTTTTTISGDVVDLGLGSRDGVQVGMTGHVTKQEMVGGQLQTFEIARFRVTAVESASCSARLTDVGEGWRVESGMEVVFDQPLRPPALDKTVIVIRSNVSDDVAFVDGRRLGPTPQSVEVEPGTYLVRVEKEGYQAVEERVSVVAGQTAQIRASLNEVRLDPAELLRQGNVAWDAQDWERAAERYEGLLAQVPVHPVALSRAAVARQKLEAHRTQVEKERRKREEQGKLAREKEERSKREQALLPLYRETANMFLDQGDRAGAAEWLKKISAVDPDDPFLRATLELVLNDLDQALLASEIDTAEDLLAWVEGVLPEGFGEELETRISSVKRTIEDLYAARSDLKVALVSEDLRQIEEAASRLKELNSDDSLLATANSTLERLRKFVTATFEVEFSQAVNGNSVSLFCDGEQLETIPLDRVKWNMVTGYKGVVRRHDVLIPVGTHEITVGVVLNRMESVQHEFEPGKEYIIKADVAGTGGWVRGKIKELGISEK